MNNKAKNLINFTDQAALKVVELISEEKNKSDFNLRVHIVGGGCSGFQYNFSFDKKKNSDDMAFENMGVTLLIDSLSFQYLEGSDIDYEESANGAHFIIRNPKAKTTCGCGSSFSI